MAALGEKFQRVEILERRDYAPDLWSVRVRPEQKLAFKPGQYATLGAERDGKLVERAYSIVSAPEEDEIEFFFELVPQGELTPLLYDLGAGQTMVMRRQSKGLFTLDAKTGHRRHYLLSTVTGVAPYVSMVRSLARAEQQGRKVEDELVVIQAASRSWEFAYREELEALARPMSWLTYLPTVSRPWEDAAWKGEVGRIEDILRKYLDQYSMDPSTTTAYVCGHPQMIENAKGILARRGFPKQFVREEVYWIPPKNPTAEKK